MTIPEKNVAADRKCLIGTINLPGEDKDEFVRFFSPERFSLSDLSGSAGSILNMKNIITERVSSVLPLCVQRIPRSLVSSLGSTVSIVAVILFFFLLFGPFPFVPGTD